MRWAIIIVRTLFGALFLFTGLSYFFNLMEMPPPEDATAQQFMSALVASGYMMPAIKLVEVTAGAMLLTGLFAALGLVLIAPVVVNITLYHAFLAHDKPTEIGFLIVLPVVWLFLAFGYRYYYATLFHPWPTPRW